MKDSTKKLLGSITLAIILILMLLPYHKFSTLFSVADLKTDTDSSVLLGYNHPVDGVFQTTTLSPERFSKTEKDNRVYDSVYFDS